MVDVMGHFGMALLFAAPAWFLWSRRGALAFTAFTLVTAMLPDVDLFLRHYLPVQHHGVTHTLLFVAVVSVVAGAVAAWTLTDYLAAHRRIRSTELSERTVFVFATGAFLLGGISHLFADMLSAPDIASPIEPFWPFFEKPVSVDLIYYNDPLWNAGLLAAAVTLHLVLAYYEGYPLDTRYRIGPRDRD